MWMVNREWWMAGRDSCPGGSHTGFNPRCGALWLLSGFGRLRPIHYSPLAIHPHPVLCRTAPALLSCRPSSMISVTIKNVTKRFGDVAALERVDLEIAPGEIFFLLGPSGCGKTTLLRCIAGFYVPDEGEIFFGEENVTRVPPHKRNAAMMFQSYALWPHMTVAKNVAFGLEEKKLPRAEIQQRVREALASVKMDQLGSRRIHQLSGGQQQRVALARALVVRPRCLLLDEPLSNLDAKLRLEMRGEIRRVCKESGLTAIYVTHDQKEALSIADRIAILDNGRVCQVGAPAEIYRRPKSRLVADFIGETNILAGTIRAASDGAAMVATSAGEFSGVLSAPEWRPAPGESVLLSIRPESWRIGLDVPAANFAKGRIEDAVYLGEMAQYRFVSGDHTLKIFELNPKFVELGRDRQIYASAEPEDVVVLPGETK
jgi:ABC-type Fe3+/spermidine/putrescine transport system ATPase subunit